MQAQTIAYYNTHAVDFCADTVQADMTSVYAAFMEALPSKQATILDCGCGSGRDSKFFLEQGYQVEALDASEALCGRASRYTGLEVRHQAFQDIDDIAIYDGIWACASLLHVSAEELPMVLRRLRDALKPQGVLYMSFKLGDFEGMKNGRYFTNLTEKALEALLAPIAGLQLDRMWQTGDVRETRARERWLNALVIRTSKTTN